MLPDAFDVMMMAEQKSLDMMIHVILRVWHIIEFRCVCILWSGDFQDVSSDPEKAIHAFMKVR